jgi:tetratricopeptide (TPR) repeat protein
MFTRGNSEAAGVALTRALFVATVLDDGWNQLRLLCRLHIFHERIGEYVIAMAYARQAVEVAELINQPEAIGIAFSLSGISHHLAGDQKRARRELELSLERSPTSLRSRTIHYGFDHRNRSGIALARVLWLGGHSEDARRVAAQTVREADQLNHPVTQCIALIWSLTVFLWIGDLAAAEKALDQFSIVLKSTRWVLISPRPAASAASLRFYAASGVMRSVGWRRAFRAYGPPAMSCRPRSFQWR